MAYIQQNTGVKRDQGHRPTEADIVPGIGNKKGRDEKLVCASYLFHMN
jgi:hypothetical protein